VFRLLENLLRLTLVVGIALYLTIWVNLLEKSLDITHDDKTGHVRHQFRKTTALSCHICLINTGVEKMNYI